jgi:hypothetical protein
VASVVVVGATAATLAGVSAYAMRSSRAVDESMAPQVANRAAKSSRLASLVPVALNAPESPVYTLASAPQSADLDRFYDTVTASIPAVPEIEPQPAAAVAAAAPAEAPAAEPKHAALALAPMPHERPKLLPPPPAPPKASGLLDDNQIAGLKGRLHLTSDQIEYWPAVEDALRDVVRTQLRFAPKQGHGGKVNIDVNSPEVQKLIFAAVPLLMRLREDQKREVRKLARVIGLEQVASQI